MNYIDANKIVPEAVALLKEWVNDGNTAFAVYLEGVLPPGIDLAKVASDMWSEVATQIGARAVRGVYIASIPKQRLQITLILYPAPVDYNKR